MCSEKITLRGVDLKLTISLRSFPEGPCALCNRLWCTSKLPRQIAMLSERCGGLPTCSPYPKGQAPLRSCHMLHPSEFLLSRWAKRRQRLLEGAADCVGTGERHDLLICEAWEDLSRSLLFHTGFSADKMGLFGCQAEWDGSPQNPPMLWQLSLRPIFFVKTFRRCCAAVGACSVFLSDGHRPLLMRSLGLPAPQPKGGSASGSPALPEKP